MSSETTDLLLAGSRWLTYLGAIAIVGARGAQLVAGRARTPLTLEFTTMIDRRLPGLALLASFTWTAGLLAMLVAQSVSWFGADGATNLDRIRSVIGESRWGAAWLRVFGCAAVAVVLHLLARAVPVLRSRAIVVASLLAVVATPLIGHAAGQGARPWILHSMHIAGAGLWLGTLLILARATWPLWSDRSTTAAGLRALLTAFTPVALVGAGLVMITGAVLTTDQIWPLGTFFDTAYGGALSRKLVVVVVIVGLGWLNWRNFRPAAEDSAVRARLRRSVGWELALGLLAVLALTAWLTGLAPPTS